MVSHHPVMCGGHRTYGSGDMNISANIIANLRSLIRRTSVAVYTRLRPPLLFFLKHMSCNVPHASQITT